MLLHAAGQKMTYCPAAFTVCLQIISGIFLSRLNFLFRIGGREIERERERERLDDDHNNFCQPFQVVMLKFDVLCSRCW